VDAFLKNQGSQLAAPQQAQQQPQPQESVPTQQSGPQILGLAQILVVVPEGSPPARVQELRHKAEGLLKRVRGGADFAGVAASSSDGPKALSGGELGVRPVSGWPDLFLQATQKLKPGEVSDIIQSGNGFHILKVLTRGPAHSPAQASGPTSPASSATAANAPPQQQGPMMVTQTHARHILIKTTKVMSDEKAQTRLNQLRQRLVNGESFEDLAKRYSEDVSAPQGGDLGWLTPGETVPPFEQAMNALQPNQISEPVKSQFGWHLIQVLERRTKNMENEFKRMQARQILFQRRVEPAFEDWLSQLHGQAYIDNRLDPQSNRNRR
jgi:peptidyl-prolyl cis-trans isomerase SurA